MSKKKKHHEEHEEHVNHEAWVIPYADMLTLLMALFLVMWATSQVDVNKAREVAAGFADSLNIVGNGDGVGGDGVLDGGIQPDAKPSLNESKALSALENSELVAAAKVAAAAQLDSVKEQVNATATEGGIAQDLSFRQEERGLIISIMSEGVLFDGGSAQLRPEGKAVLDQLAPVLIAAPNRLAIEGHTDNRPINTALYPSNWELSSARASAVLRYLVEVRGVPKDRVKTSGLADTSPVADNDTPSGRSKNRRVDIAVLSEAIVVGLPSAEPHTINTAPIIDHAATEGGSHE